MAYFADLSPHVYTEHELEPGVLNVGWLGEGHCFPQGDAPAPFVAALQDLCSRPILLHRGVHTCEFCRDAWGNGQVRVCSTKGSWFSAPTMVHHYVTAHQYLPPAEFVEAVVQPLHVADATTEIDQTTWDADVRRVFTDWQTDAATQRWPAVQAALQINQPVQGMVVARAPFGVWVDIGVGMPALLLVPYMWQAKLQRMAFTDYAPKGTLVRAYISALGPNCQIGLTQQFLTR